MTTSAQSSPLRRWWTRPALQAGFVAFILGGLAQWWAQRTHVVFAFWDAQAHLDIARRVLDATTPGVQMLGTVWLPIPHLLLLPFVMVDPWWWNGLAGGLVGLLAYITIVASLHALLVRRTGRPRLAWLGTAFVALNPSLLYLQTTAMTEPVLLAFLVGSVAALDRWNDQGSRRALLVAGILAALAVGSRYDGWFFVALATPTVAWLSWRNARRWLVDAVVFALPGAIMAAAWLGYNALFFGDPLAFQRGAWSAQSQQAALAAQGLLPTKGHLLLDLTTYLGATILTSGALLTALALIALPTTLRHFRRSGPILLLLAALPFNVLALFGGQSAIQLPWTHPAGILNLRYGIMVLPGLAATLTYGLSRLLRARPAWGRGTQLASLTCVAVQLALFGAGWPSHVGALREGLAIRDGDRRQQAASDWLAGSYDGGRVLVDEAVNISPRTRIPIRERIYEWSWQLGPAALAAPEREVDWVVVDERHADGKVARAIAGRGAFRDRFDRVFEDGGLEIWRRR